MQASKYDQSHIRVNSSKDWCEADVSKYGPRSAYHEFRGCKRTAKFVIGGEKLCELHAGQKCLNYLLKGDQDEVAADDAGTSEEA